MRVDIVEAGLASPEQEPAARLWTADDGRFACPATGLFLLAGATPDGVDVQVWDEKTRGPYVATDAELVGLSFKTMHAARAYELADGLRAGGKLVVMGGQHVSLVPDEAAAHADVVVLGEADELWPAVVRDAMAGDLQRVYRAESPPDITHIPPQRTDLVDVDRYLFHAVQTARGCSLDCEFCPTRHMFGAGFRLRSAEIVLSEVRALLARQHKPIFFSDDIFGAGQRQYMAELSGGLRRLSVPYVIVSDLAFLRPEMIELLAASGCFAVVLNMPGSCSPGEASAVGALRRAGIAVWGYFMFGFENHEADVFERCARFVRQTGIEGVFLTVLAPYKGTPMGDRLLGEDRILSADWRLYDQAHVVMKPNGMTAEQLAEGFSWIRQELDDLWGISQMWSRAERRIS